MYLESVVRNMISATLDENKQILKSSIILFTGAYDDYEKSKDKLA